MSVRPNRPIPVPPSIAKRYPTWGPDEYLQFRQQIWDIKTGHQHESEAGASNRGKRWTQEEAMLAVDPSMTVVEAAMLLDRTYYAIHNVRTAFRAGNLSIDKLPTIANELARYSGPDVDELRIVPKYPVYTMEGAPKVQCPACGSEVPTANRCTACGMEMDL